MAITVFDEKTDGKRGLFFIGFLFTITSSLQRVIQMPRLHINQRTL
jgi:hypothetical protein